MLPPDAPFLETALALLALPFRPVTAGVSPVAAGLPPTLLHPCQKFGVCVMPGARIISRETPTVETAMLMTSTLPYMSPEQTGRMNRMVDWRTDFYSLGVTLYELFTGRLPFEATEPLELVHAHMALMPEPLHEINENIPPVLSRIILKVMAKDAEDRYQSALGIVHDLKACRDQLSASGRIDSFEIGQKDISGLVLTSPTICFATELIPF